MSTYHGEEVPLCFTVLVTTAFYLALCFAALCLACGFYYLAELSEEYTVLTRKILRTMVYVVWALYALLWLVDGFPLYCILTGLLSHACYYSLLPRFPFVTLLSVRVLASCVAFVASHLVWYHHFMDPYGPLYTYGHLLGFFFLCIWMVPFGLFITVTVDNMALPGAGSIDSASDDAAFGGLKRPKITHFLAAGLSFLKGKVFGRDPDAQPLSHKAY
eukprot:TRINITY_DN2236_c0_g1_i1.p2 TRINITY_DN2236_c0_g1~~TRINITY_DN2236_c0_g1_i1.p2  ORF type:complete len:217 (+),score=92.80 TRINITY_DN2236_c0_g1_i1:76-726(+)